MTNRGGMLPFRLPTVARSLVEGLIATDSTSLTAHELGRALNRQGLGLSGLIEAQSMVMETIALAGGTGLAELIGGASRFIGGVIEGFSVAEATEIHRQREEMERAFMASAAQQREQEHLLRSAINELSVPIIPVYNGILVLPLIGSIDSHRANQITEGLLDAISSYQGKIIIIDITGVPLIDTATANHLLLAARAAELLGSQVILVGIGPEIAQTIVHSGISLGKMITLANLQAGISYALGYQGMGIRALEQGSAATRPSGY
ncbi:MAG: STAS domain-containing protein [Herpetosiphonaceae bacterium]|nr:STAS domain-containing protein [Herpetosiphonaceae bacterium]